MPSFNPPPLTPTYRQMTEIEAVGLPQVKMPSFQVKYKRRSTQPPQMLLPAPPCTLQEAGAESPTTSGALERTTVNTPAMVNFMSNRFMGQ